MTFVPPSPPYRPIKPKRHRLNHLQSQMRHREPLLLTSIVCREKRQHNLNRVHHNSRHLHQSRPAHPRARHPPPSLLHLKHRVHITPVNHTTILLIHMRPTTHLLMRRMATRILTLRILNRPHRTQSMQQATIHHHSLMHRLSTLPILLRNRLPRSIMLTIFQVTRR